MAERSELSLSFAPGYGSGGRVSNPFEDPFEDSERPVSGVQRASVISGLGTAVPWLPASRPHSLVNSGPYADTSAFASSEQLFVSPAGPRVSIVGYGQGEPTAGGDSLRTRGGMPSNLRRLSHLRDEIDGSSSESSHGSVVFRSPSSLENDSPISVVSSQGIPEAIAPPAPVEVTATAPPVRPPPVPLHQLVVQASAANLSTLRRPNHPGKVPDWKELTTSAATGSSAENPFLSPPMPSPAGSLGTTRQGLLKLNERANNSSSNVSFRDDVDYSRPLAEGVHNRTPSSATARTGNTFGGQRSTPATIFEDPFQSLFDDSVSQLTRETDH
ncbi:hypothetical protein OE88DRAFT_1547697 [Heliocybe sulcata]|uniref:Uncharacterized protein n=1 Tax=Heliocybe sulcata TaxID=5364 RepID=A0A5C3N321_9AGAM|nr:hypothetical protein OE88DRAFT_1547697 [Heliocybe sulcata]